MLKLDSFDGGIMIAWITTTCIIVLLLFLATTVRYALFICFVLETLVHMLLFENISAISLSIKPKYKMLHACALK